MPAAVLRLSDLKPGFACGIVTRRSRSSLMQPIRSPASLVSEDKPVAILESRVPETELGPCRKQPQPARGRGAGAERLPVGMLVDVEREPVVHARAPQVSVRDLEPEGMDQVKTRPGQRAHPAHVARVLGDFGLEKDDMDHRQRQGGNRLPHFLARPETNASALRVAICLVSDTLGKISKPVVSTTRNNPPQEPRSVVIVDDEKSYVELMAQMIADNLDCQVHPFTRPEDALNGLATISAGVIVTDYFMPQMDGVEFITARLQDSPPGRVHHDFGPQP